MLKYAKLSLHQIEGAMACFCKDATASMACKKLNLNRNTINRFYGLFRAAIYYYRASLLKKNFPRLKKINVDFPKKNQGMHINHTLIGLLMGNGGYYAEIIPRDQVDGWLRLIREQVWKKGYVFLAEKNSYAAFVDMVYNKYYPISHTKNLPPSPSNNDSLFAFWKFTYQRLLKFNGGYRAKFKLHLKESEWRYQKDVIQMKKELKIIFKAYLEKENLLKRSIPKMLN